MRRSMPLLVLILVLSIALISFKNLSADDMPHIVFDIGRDIVEVAKKSGAPKYVVRDIDGLISYDLPGIPESIAFRYQRSGYEISVDKVFSFTLYADKENNNGLAVETAALQLLTDEIKSHSAAKILTESLIAQFQGGKWKRHIADLCPAVSGRSSFLDENGEAGQIFGCPLDQSYRLSSDEWLQLMRETQHYIWIGDGVLARLTVGFSDDRRGITYAIGLEFEDFAIMNKRQEAERSRRLAAGDAKGKNSTVNEAKQIEAVKQKILILEENARRRGDRVIDR